MSARQGAQSSASEHELRVAAPLGISSAHSPGSRCWELSFWRWGWRWWTAGGMQYCCSELWGLGWGPCSWAVNPGSGPFPCLLTPAHRGCEDTVYTWHGMFSWCTVGPQVVITSIVAADDSPLSGTHSQGQAGGQFVQGPARGAGQPREPGLVQPGAGRQAEPVGAEPGRAEQELTPQPLLLLPASHLQPLLLIRSSQ